MNFEKEGDRMTDNSPLPFLKNGVAQIALVVRNLEETVEQYHQLLAPASGSSIPTENRC
jgi:hypothetical protein